MKRFTSVFALGLAATLTLGGCNAAKDVADGAQGAVEGAAGVAGDVAASAGDAVSGAADSTTEAAGGAAGNLMAMKDGVTGITSAIGDTTEAVKSGNFEGAREAFDKVESSWQGMKGMVGDDMAGKVQEQIASVDENLNSTTPQADTILSSLGGLKDVVGGLMGAGN